MGARRAVGYCKSPGENSGLNRVVVFSGLVWGVCVGGGADASC